MPNVRPKLADFGLSRPVECVGSDLLEYFHVRWTAPEVWNDHIDEEDGKNKTDFV